MGMLKEPKERKGLPQGKPTTFFDRVVRFRRAPDPKFQRELKKNLRSGFRWFRREVGKTIDND